MTRRWWTKLALVVFLSVLSLAYVMPTFLRMDPATSKFPVKERMNLGLDLQGGLYMVLGINFEQVFRDLLDRQSQVLQVRLKDKALSLTDSKVIREGFPVDDPRLVMTFDAAQRDKIYTILKDEFPELRITGEKAGELQVGIAREKRVEIRERTVGQSIQVIRNRIDEFGVTEPSITSQGADRVVVELPGVKEVEHAKDLIGQTARLEFKMVDAKSMDPAKLVELVAQAEKEKGISLTDGKMKPSEYFAVLNEAVKSKLPEGREIAFGRMDPTEDGAPMDAQAKARATRWVPYLLVSQTRLTGEDLADAQVGFDTENQNRPLVHFTLNPRGAATFDKLTSESIGTAMAIVLDRIVHSAPVIQSRISGGRGQISLGRGNQEAMLREAKDLAIVLRAGALPAPLEFLEQRVVGPSLGQDSIQKGALASLIGILAVFAFTAIYYRVSGVIAVVSLVLNVLFVLAILVGLEATLTLPGIAGIALTVGIAVDSNVVIYERIREELWHGKSIAIAVEAGFQKAFRTILDANVTNAIAAFILLNYGTGPIKGFAVSLLIGIVTTLFTAVFVCKVIFDAYLVWAENRRAQTLSI